MNTNDIPAMIADALSHIAPEVEIDEIDMDEDLREECDLDSMDFLNLVAELRKSTGINIPQSDYPKVRSYNQLQQYLQNHSE